MAQPPRYLRADGHNLPLSTWVKRTGIPANTIRARLDDYGWTVEQALGLAPSDSQLAREKRAARRIKKPKRDTLNI